MKTFRFLTALLMTAVLSSAQAKKDVSTPQSLEASPAGNQLNVLSKDYRKSATIAVASIATWEQTARTVTNSTHLHNDALYVNRNARAREREARESAERDVRLAKLDAQTSADKELHNRLEQYYEAVKSICDFSVDGSASLVPPSDQDSAKECPVIIKSAIEAGLYIPKRKDKDKCLQP